MKNSTQRGLFDKIEKMAGRPALLEALKNLLFLEKSAIYQRLTGERSLTADEAIDLADHFGIAFDTLRGRNGHAATFLIPEKARKTVSPLEYMETVWAQMLRLDGLPKVRIYFASSDLFLFYYLPFRSLYLFKLYDWSRNAFRIEHFLDRKFDPTDLAPFGGERVLEIANDLWSRFLPIESVEIWPATILDNTLNQLRHHARSGHFLDKKTGHVLFDQLLELLDFLEKMARSAQKPKSPDGTAGAQFGLFVNQIAHSNNLILIASGRQPARALLAFDSPYFIETAEQVFLDHANDVAQKLLKNSALVSGAAENERELFFKSLRQRIENFRMEAFE